MTHPALLLLLAVAAAASTAIAQKEPRLLRYDLQPGAEGEYAVRSKVHTLVQSAGPSMETTVTIDATMRYRVVERDKRGARVHHEMQSLKMQVDSPGRVTKFDSETGEPAPPQLGAMPQLIGQTIEAETDDRGRLLGEPRIVDHGGDAVEAKGVLDQFLVELPEAPVAVGESWTTETRQALGPDKEMVLRLTNVLVSFDGQNAKIGQTLTYERADQPKDLPAQVELEPTTGDLQVNLHRPVPMAMQQNMRMTTTTSAPGHEIKMRINSETAVAPVMTKRNKQ
ncbi:MAG: hypothetical protein AAF628_12845 [Planctomycetota bacterium]